MTIQEKAIEQLERVSKHLAIIGEKEDYTGIAIQALEQQNRIAQILDNYDLLEAWEILEMIKGVMKE